MSEDDNLTDAQREAIEREKAQFRKESGKEVVVKIENDTSLQQERLWDDAKNSIAQEYEARGLKFDPSSIHTKEDMENEFEKLRKMRSDEKQIEALQKAQAGSGGVPITGRQLGLDDKPTGDRSVEYLKKLAQEMPIDLMQFNSETEMLRFLENVSHDTNHPSCKEAEKLYQKVLAHTFQKTSSYEFQGEGKSFGKKEGKWRKKQGVED
jgi:hypothetical protein